LGEQYERNRLLQRRDWGDSMGVCAHTGLWVPQQKIFGHNDSMWAAFCGKSIEQETAMLSMEMMANIIAYMEHADIERYVVDDESKAGQVLFDGLDNSRLRVILHNTQWLLLRLRRPSG
jgi:hypothetical protein